MTVARVALPLAADSTFDYWIPAGLAVTAGVVVRVPLARRTLTGVVVGSSETAAVDVPKLLPITEIVQNVAALPADLLELADFAAGYYQEPLGLVLAQMVPPLGRGAPPARRTRKETAGSKGSPDAVAGAVAESHGERTVAGVLLNEEQQRAVDAIVAAHRSYAPFLLQGITGSGKTEVYLAAAAHCIAAGAQALVLVPEINLTPQFAQRVVQALPGRRTVTLHSRLAAGERARNWRAAAEGEADLVLGTRLAAFVPLPRLGLIVVDEEHDASFKQQEGVRYHGRDIAVWRAHRRTVPVVLGSATPALETLLHAQRGRYGWLKLTRRAAGVATLPALRYVPNRGPDLTEGMSAPLIAAIATRLERREQSLVFINRRGFAPSLLCSACGWQAACHRCSARLVVHREARQLRCHHCGHAERIAIACPSCGNVDLLPLGQGTQRLERFLSERFPQARIERIDRDSTRRVGAFAAARERVHAGEVDILVGTQMLAKGHDFPQLTLVGVLGADNALYSADFRATERLAALLFQVTGRAGRADLPGEVIVQTDFPDHPLYRALAAHDYEGWAGALLAERRAAELPPFAHLALLVAEAPGRDAVDAFLAAASAAGNRLVGDAKLSVDVFPPVVASLARRAGLERGQVLARAAERSALQRLLPLWRRALLDLRASRVRWALDVDPLGFA
jgi:primosomal protein N' (replication factor Y)